MKRSRAESSISSTSSVASSTTTSTSTTPRCLHPLRVLYVDPADSNLKVRSKNLELAINRHLQGGVAFFDVVRDGLEAIHLANKVEYDIIFVSSKLKVVKAFNVSSCLRECLVECPMVLVTTDKANNQGVSSDAAANGFDAILTEPFMGDAVGKVITKLCIGRSKTCQIASYSRLSSINDPLIIISYVSQGNPKAMIALIPRLIKSQQCLADPL